MQSFSSFLIEGRDAPLFHATELANIERILSQNKMNGSMTILGIRGVSLTREQRFAVKWNDLRIHTNPAIIVFDQAELARDHKIIPFNYFFHEPSFGKYDKRPAARFHETPLRNYAKSAAQFYVDDDAPNDEEPGNEYEELVKGDIVNVKSYIKAILIPNGNAKSTVNLLHKFPNVAAFPNIIVGNNLNYNHLSRMDQLNRSITIDR